MYLVKFNQRVWEYTLGTFFGNIKYGAKITKNVTELKYVPLSMRNVLFIIMKLNYNSFVSRQSQTQLERKIKTKANKVKKRKGNSVRLYQTSKIKTFLCPIC